MSESFVIRLAPAALDVGVLAGELEVIRTGESVLFRSDDELIEVLAARAIPADKRKSDGPSGQPLP